MQIVNIYLNELAFRTNTPENHYTFKETSVTIGLFFKKKALEFS